ncbi:GNAT family N-acetyltransferase [Nocardia sp. NBC_01503]|uniref:GNAT family N-acetyltransferase n=1 Tax=Nocardia sp. NBC_01503 TaxID=2975997 RepID=UPI002E7C3A7A|nr:GNAT family N-acetyltransferase [Nocardia sp. NBC_01503]WTL36272.1 GNAT family N-acetyltransferase [Nocardia sp. NBC_01503]
MFCGVELGARIERVETELIATGSAAAAARLGDEAGFVIPIGGGVASFAAMGSPLNKVAGLGFAGVPDPDEFEALEKQYAVRDAPVQVELAHLGDPGIAELLTGRGYRLISYENVLGLDLTAPLEPSTAQGVSIRPSGAGEFEVWLDIVTDGFAHPDTQGVVSHEEFPREIIADAMRDLTAAAGVQRYAAIHRDAVAGVASMRISQGIAQLTGATTLPAHRRHGIQSALLSARLTEAAAAGCDIATITTQPGSKSQQNAQRRGFSLLYTRAILVK